ncbi:MAG: hypothetical protein IPO87_15310 [Flavobacteriales bacterium]|nr:hypothetical protein [Flavobacteriales bacterium]
MAAAPKAQQRGNIVDANDLRYFLRIVTKNWYFVAVALLLSSVLSYLYSYKLPDIYGATTQLLLKDRDVYNYQSEVYKNLGYAQAYSDIVNQKRVLTSYDLIDATLTNWTSTFPISLLGVSRPHRYTARSPSQCTSIYWTKHCMNGRSICGSWTSIVSN